jgi:H+/Na+-translocating ferredoxin:NAD+ oxidoreductase subunit D
MTKDVLMKYTFVALCILAAVSFLSWGIESVILSLISVLVAVAFDYLLSLVMNGKGPLNTMSAAVFGLIVALSYSLGISTTLYRELLPLTAPWAYVYVTLISIVGMVLFKKLQGLGGRKYVNPAAAAKLIVFLPFLNEVFLPIDHSQMLPSLTSAIGFSGSLSFGSFLQSCFANAPLVGSNVGDVLYTLTVLKHHGWIGGASSIAVIVVGIALFALCRRYIKWRVTATYLATVALSAFVLSNVYGGDPLLRVGFHLFIGSSIFLAFFMATDPATTPLTYLGQVIFGAGLGVLTVLIQTYLNFLGGSILALVIMNLTSPMLDKVGKLRPRTEKITPKLPKPSQFTAVKVTECIRCGACMRSCCHHLSPILIKKAFDKGNLKAARKLQANLCEGCGHCNFVCPARIDLKSTILRAEAALRSQVIA